MTLRAPSSPHSGFTSRCRYETSAIFVGAALFVPLLAMSIACDNASPQKEKKEEFRWNDVQNAPHAGPVFEDEDFTISAKPPKSCETVGPMAPTSGARRLSVPVEVRAKTARPVPVSAFLFTLEDAQGHEFRPTLAGCAPAIKQKTIVRGESVVGEVAFDVPAAFSTAELRFEPFLIGRQKVTARVKVPATEK